MSDKTVQRSNMTQYDSKGNVLRAPIDNSAGDAVNFRWWLLDADDMARAIQATVLFIKRHQGSRLEQLVLSTKLYGNTNGYNLIGTAFTRASSTASNPMSGRISFNLCESIVDTLESKIAKNKISPTFITNGGDWSVQFKAEMLTKFTQGLFYGLDVHQKSIYAWKDAAIWGDGFLKVFEKEDKVAIERVYPHELLVDVVESLSGPPQQLHQVRIMDRDIALSLYPELEEHIKTVSPANYQDIGGQGTAVDLITAIESWHLKSGEHADDGVHAITIGEGSLVETYDEPYFPFAHIRYARRQIGFYGQGVCERLQNLQQEINRSMILKQRSLWMQGSFKILVPIGSKIVSQHLNNDVGSIVMYSGEPPTYITPPASNPELQQWIDTLIGYGYSQEGISRMATTGESPLGVESGKAMRTLSQISDDRFLFMQQEMENFVLDIGRKAINVAKKIYKQKKSYEVIFPDSTFLETIDWKDINLEEEEYVLKAFPASSLSDDLTGRLSEVQELVQAGMISPRAARRQLDMPDLEVADALANSPEDRLRQIFEDMLNYKKKQTFQPGFHDAELGRQLAIQYINYAEFRRCPDENIQLVREFLEQINSPLIQTPPGLAQPGMGAAQMQPQANPMPAPQSNLIQNVPGVSQ